MKTYLDFETRIAELEGKIAELKSLAAEGEEDTVSLDEDIGRLEEKVEKALADLYANLDPWQKTQVARHPERPHTLDYIRELITDFTPLAGDRKFAEDHAIIGGPGRFRGEPVMVIGQEKGHDLASRQKHNFGMARPEGYRKAVRLMDMAERFNLPVISFVDTAGAYPGVGAEERGQAEAIARSTERCLTLGVPNVALIIGEGGSGGAIAIATANRVLMLEHAIYSVISPEGAASILWRDSAKAPDAAKALRLTAQDLKEFGVIDEIVPEPVGGAHRAPQETIKAAGEAIARALEPLMDKSPDEIRRLRRERFLSIGRNLG
ncbi:acetyl-CoA carboxylase carboxyltransferase subunit alpha [Thermopetrobacter sp. TC1]|uniref:acetyl-CoA carboxylase carboxyltransferase subunit alpha n=1 Tax=Thermopetrobacter sp. TC1 TaxID=1495045 RepID=UPI0005707ECD|nr:acetyl-CoA carboxylase carboxyltransferase subunit alpha [Thermopetrobacter sp. TC1]